MPENTLANTLAAAFRRRFLTVKPRIPHILVDGDGNALVDAEGNALVVLKREAA
jgi:hypothetical protein